MYSMYVCGHLLQNYFFVAYLDITLSFTLSLGHLNGSKEFSYI